MCSCIELSPTVGVSCGHAHAYNPGVDDFGSRLKAIREGLDLSQREIGRRAVQNDDAAPTAESFSNHWSRVERGEEQNPSMEFLERAARGLGVPMSEFFRRLEGVGPTDVTDSLPTMDEVASPGEPQSPPISPEQSEFLEKLAWACLRGADVAERLSLQGVLEDLAFSFRRAADPAATSDERAKGRAPAARQKRGA